MSNEFDSVRVIPEPEAVRHVGVSPRTWDRMRARGEISTATFKSFEQGATKMQSESVDWIWIDERCPEDVFSELLARTTATDGILFMSYTPLKGGGELTYRFLNEYSADRSDSYPCTARVRSACG